MKAIGDLSGRTYGGGTPSSDEPGYWSGDIPWIQSSDVAEQGVAQVAPRKHITKEAISRSAAMQIPADSVAVVTRVGVGKVSFMPFPYATSQDFVSLSDLSGDPEYIALTVKWRMEGLADQLQGSTIKGITKTELLHQAVYFPPTLEEQQAIGAIFTNLDAAINQHTTKHQVLQQAKTALMQRMFPQAGQAVPELRLDGFDGEWEKTAMSNIASFSKGSGYSKNDFRASGTPLFHYGRLYTNYQLAVTTVDTFAQMRPGSTLSRGNEVLIPSSGETAEDIATACALLQAGVILGGDLNIVRPKPDYDNVFLALSFSQGVTKAALKQKAQGKTVVHIHNSDIRSLDVFIPPTLEEQQAIGAVFTRLDTLITTEAKYIESLKQAKSALLQQMFI
ncbi:restriction endonuclease subunit S [Corynebacterium segmentosum]